MAAHPSARVQRTGEIVAEHMDAILSQFRSGAKITVLVRQPEKTDGSQDFILTNDEIIEAIRALQVRLTAPTLKGDI